jgi:hypothetical protein
MAVTNKSSLFPDVRYLRIRTSSLIIQRIKTFVASTTSTFPPTGSPGREACLSMIPKSSLAVRPPRTVKLSSLFRVFTSHRYFYLSFFGHYTPPSSFRTTSSLPQSTLDINISNHRKSTLLYSPTKPLTINYSATCVIQQTSHIHISH